MLAWLPARVLHLINISTHSVVQLNDKDVLFRIYCQREHKGLK